MKNMLKKMLSIGLVLMVVLTLSACGNDTSSGKKEIVIWNAGITTTAPDGGNDEDLPINKVIKDFEAKHEDVKVTIVGYSMDDLLKSFTAANMAKKGPDLVALWAGSSTLGMQDVLLDLTPYLTEEEKTNLDVSALTHKNNDFNNALIGVPFGLPATGVMYMNKQIFEENGLQVPTTWDELIEISDILVSKGITPLMLGDKDGYTSTWVIASLLANLLGPNDIKNLGNSKEKISDKNFTNSLKLWKEYVDAGYTNPDYLTKSDGDAIEAFVQGKSAMVIHGNWALSEFKSMGDNIEITKIPAYSKDAPYAEYIYSQPNINLVIPNYSENKELAAELLKIIVGEEFRNDSNAAYLLNPTESRLYYGTNELSDAGKNVTGFDSIITAEAANEFYKLVPMYLKGGISLEDFTSKLDALNQ